MEWIGAHTIIFGLELVYVNVVSLSLSSKDFAWMSPKDVSLLGCP